MNPKKFGPYLVLIAAMLWATDAPFRLHLTQSLSSNFIVLAEHFIDILFVLPILIWSFKDLKGLSWKRWLAIIVIAVGGSALASIAFTQAFKYVNPSVAILLQKLQPLLAISLAASLLKESINRFFWLWSLIAMFGAYLISFPNFVPRLFEGEQFNPNLIGVLLALAAALLWGASTVMGRYVLQKIDFKLMTSLRFVIAFIFLLIINLTTKSIPQLSTVTGKDWFYLGIIAVTSGVVSLFIYYRGLQYTKASVATIAELGFPLAAVLINFVFLDAKLLPVQIFGMAVLLYGVFRLSRLNGVEEIAREAIPITS